MKLQRLDTANLILTVLALLLCLTPFYSIGYLLLLIVATRILSFSRIFSTLFARAILVFLLLAASVAIAGTAAWLLHTVVYPLFVYVTFVVIIYVLHFLTNAREGAAPRFIDRSDIISIALSLLAPVIIFLSFYFPHFTQASSYQIITNGWDNSSHLVMLETASLENGYIYGDNSLKSKTILESNTYPQAWHLASAHLADGFGVKLFNPSHPLTAINTYIIVLLLWFTIAIYCFSKVAWRVFETARPKAKYSWLDMLLFSIVNILIQLMIFWGSLYCGFANYIGCIAYLSILAAAVIDAHHNKTTNAGLAIVSGAMATMSWFLPIPAIIATVLLCFIDKDTLKHICDKTRLNRTLLLGGVVVISLVSALLPIIMFILYSTSSGSEQLNTVGGVFPISIIGVGVLFIFSLLSSLRMRQSIIPSAAIQILSPMVLLTASIYAYQLFTSGSASYYLYKIIGFLTVFTGIFLIPTFVLFCHNNFRLSNPYKLIAGASLVAAFIVASNQSITPFNRLLQRSSIVDHQTASIITYHLEHDDPKKVQLVVLRHTITGSVKNGFRSEDYNGDLLSKVAHQPLSCVDGIVNKTSGKSLEGQYANLMSCALQLKTQHMKLIVITSNKTVAKVAEIAKVTGNIQIVNNP